MDDPILVGDVWRMDVLEIFWRMRGMQEAPGTYPMLIELKRKPMPEPPLHFIFGFVAELRRAKYQTMDEEF